MKLKRYSASGLLALPLVLALPAFFAARGPAAPDPTKTVKKVPVAPNIVLEVAGAKRRVVVSATVCLTKGPLELLMCRKNTKEHESVLSADVDARKLKQALLLTGAKEGQPVRFAPKYAPASGQVLKITLVYELKGKTHTVSGQKWVRDGTTKKPLAHNWVFAGSRLVANPFDKNKPIFLANDGDLVCVSNFESALLDLPIKSSKDNADLVFEANTEVIPPVGTKVSVIFEPVK